MPEDLPAALAEVRDLLVGGAEAGTTLVRAVAAGRRRGAQPAASRVELRPVDLRAGRRLQVVEQRPDGPVTRNLAPEQVAAAVDALLAEPFGNWHVEDGAVTLQLRVTKKGLAQVHRDRSGRGVEAAASVTGGAPRAHDRVKDHLVDPDDPLFTVLGADADKRRQVDAFLRITEPALRRARDAALLPPAAGPEPLRVVDLGCGNAYLTLAAHRWLASQGPVRTVGVELRDDLVARSTARAEQAGLTGITFTSGTIQGAEPTFAGPATAEPAGGSDGDGDAGVDVVLALHACDTATDDALARAVRWRAPLVLAAPCCHHDVQAQLGSATSAPQPYGALVRHAILRERFADVLTDALRAALLRLLGYRVDVVEFVESRHTPRNALLRAVRTGAPPTAEQVAEYADLVAQWRIEPALARALAPETRAVLGTASAAGGTGDRR